MQPTPVLVAGPCCKRQKKKHVYIELLKNIEWICFYKQRGLHGQLENEEVVNAVVENMMEHKERRKNGWKMNIKPQSQIKNVNQRERSWVKEKS